MTRLVIRCPYCGARLPPFLLARHLRKHHPVAARDAFAAWVTAYLNLDQLTSKEK